MSAHEDPRETVRVTLSPLEGQRLFALLNERIESGDPRIDLSGLDGLLDMVSDANALALWLRENVTIEPDSQEIALLREVLDNLSPASQTDTILPGIQAKLAKYQPSEHQPLGHCPTSTN